MTTINVLIADDISTTREDIKRLLYFEEDIKVIGEAADGNEVVMMAGELKPDVILMDINMPKLDGIGATEQISVKYPQCAIIIISIQGEQEYLRKAMAAGAREYLVKPFSANELSDAIRRVNDAQKRRNQFLMSPTSNKMATTPIERLKNGKVITFFCTKGGVGKTTLACNLAIALTQETKKKVALLDLDLAAGDVTVMMNINAKGSIADLVQEQDTIDFQLIDVFMMHHISGVRILPAPESPEQAEFVQTKHVEAILKELKENFDYIIVDTAPLYNDINLSVLDCSDRVILVLNQDLTTLKHVKSAHDILKALNYGTKLKFVLNQKSNEGIKVKELESALNRSITVQIENDEKTVKNAINKGIPFIMGQPYSSITNSIYEMLSAFELLPPGEKSEKTPKKSIINRMFSF